MPIMLTYIITRKTRPLKQGQLARKTSETLEEKVGDFTSAKAVLAFIKTFLPPRLRSCEDLSAELTLEDDGVLSFTGLMKETGNGNLSFDVSQEDMEDWEDCKLTLVEARYELRMSSSFPCIEHAYKQVCSAWPEVDNLK